MRFRSSIATLVLTAIGLVPHAALAQLVPDRVLAELEKTDRRIERAQGVVSESNNAAAEAELAQAVTVQAGARTQVAQGHPRVALDLTFRARAHADRAIALVNRLPDPDRVLSQLERTRDLIERAREQIEECNQDRPRAMLRTAVDMQARAEDAARAGRYLAAIQLTFSARERVQRALRLCNFSDNLQEGADRALRRTDEVIQRAEDRVSSGGDAARRELGRAQEIEARAHAEYRDGHFEASLRLTLSARAFALRALRLSGGVNIRP